MGVAEYFGNCDAEVFGKRRNGCVFVWADCLFLLRHGAFEAAAGVKVLDDGEDGNWSNGEWVGGVGCFGEGGDGCKVTGGGPWCVGGLDCVAEVGEDDFVSVFSLKRVGIGGGCSSICIHEWVTQWNMSSGCERVLLFFLLLGSG